MELDEEESLIIMNLRRKLMEIAKSDMEGLMNDLDPLFLLTGNDQIQLNTAESSEERIEVLLNILLQKGESTCLEIYEGLESLMPRSKVIEKKSFIFNEMTLQFKIKDYKHSKLTLKNILEIGKETVEKTDPQRVKDIPWHLITKLMALNSTARSTQLKLHSQNLDSDDDDDDFDDDDDDDDDDDETVSFHPLDIICFLLHCSDAFLQQEILLKMSMCQFAVPLLLPASDGQDCTFMLWAMRDIVKRWRPQSLSESKGFIENNLVNIAIPTFSFVRLGKSKLSKSKILNTILSPDQQYHNFFVHENMECGNIQRKISDGLVEISWYFPAGRDNSDTFPEPIAVTNLRGDLASSWKQFSFLTQVSSAVFIFLESLNESEFQLFTKCNISDTKYYFIISPSNGKRIGKLKLQNLKKFFPVLNINTKNILKKDSTINDAELTNTIQEIIKNALNNFPKKVKLEEMSDITYELGIQVDENSNECQKAKKCAIEITEEITDVIKYKKDKLKLQGDLWKQLSQIDKELCRLKKRGDKNEEEYKSQLREKHIELHKKQNQNDLPSCMNKFISAITHLSQTEKHYFLQWMKFKLDEITRNKLSDLKSEYKMKCSNTISNKQELNQLDKLIIASSLEVQNYLRELGQFYEAEYFIMLDKQDRRKHGEFEKLPARQFTKLPGIAADLLLDGFPLELIDGDASNVALQWITDVLTELDSKTGGKCKLRVITVLGVQSTGKSTLLNTMFGLQFPVASGRCTRGAFMTLIKVKENFQEELGCDFILVIDTEGLKAPELASLENSNEHDNELATFVIGLSDITIINMAMENIAEMKDILQIVVHAFLRMKEIGKKPKCQFVHQNVSDVSAHENNMRDRRKLLEHLDEMTKIAANMEKKSGITKFTDIMDYDCEKDNWYIPGLWQGVPPMAPVNSGYSENIYELKRYLFELIKIHQSTHKTQKISEFIEWLKIVWNSVKYEKFIFSFRNSLVANAYNQLSVQYSKWEWEICKKVHEWLIKTESNIKNQSADNLQRETCHVFKEELCKVLSEEGKKMSDLLENYFDNGSENVHHVEKYREDFFRGVTFLKEELERNTRNKFEEFVRIQKEKCKIQIIQDKCLNLIEDEVTGLLQNCRSNNRQLNNIQIKNEFETMWKKTLSELELSTIEKRNVSQTMLQQLRNDMCHKGAAINETLLNVRSLEEYGEDFQMDKKYIDTTWSSITCNPLHISQEYYDKIYDFAVSLILTCNTYVTQKMNTNADYDDTYCQELLYMINESLRMKQVSKMHISSLFEMDIKLSIFGRAAPMFQKMHENFIQEQDPRNCLEKLKPQYFSTFENIYHEKDQCQTRARCFSEVCLKPAIIEHVYKHLGKEIVDDVLENTGALTFSSRTFFQYTVLEDLLQKSEFHLFVEYINRYEIFVKNWIVNYISDKYKMSRVLESLQAKIISSINAKIKDVLKSEKAQKSLNVSTFLEIICQMLTDDLVISRNGMKAVVFQNSANVQKFSADVDYFLTETEKQVLAELKQMNIETILSKVTLKPQNELFKKVLGCGKQCPFCKVPCEAGGSDHSEHFASVHKPQGLGRCRYHRTDILTTSLCSTDIVSTATFSNSDTQGVFHPYKDYRKFYPDWAIQPDPSIESSDYWKYILTKFNEQFADNYQAKPAKLPEGWRKITKYDASKSLKEMFYMK